MNTELNELMERMEKYGQPILNKLFNLSSKELKEKICDIIGKSWFDDHCPGMIEDGIVKKVIRNDNPQEIEIGYYDSIEITSAGIYFRPEHSERKVLKIFDKYFTYDIDERTIVKCVFFDPCQGRNRCTHSSSKLSNECTKVCSNYKEDIKIE